MKYILATLFLITYIFSRDINTAYFPKWKLEVKNEFGTDEEIVLKAGQYTKVTFVVSNENDYTYYERFFDNSKFRIFLNDENLVTLEEEYEINPFESLEYTTYIGLNCENQINTKEYSFTFSSKEEENSDENIPKLKVVSTTVKIDKTPQKITLTPVSTSLLEHSVSHFILKEIIYNIKPIYIDSRESDDNFFLNSVELPEFTSEEAKFENQLLMDRFGTEKSLENLKGATEFTYHLELSEDNQCFYINEESIEFTVKVKEGEPQLFTDKNDEDFITSMENITPEYDKTNNIQIKVNIPFAPFLYYCIVDELHKELEGEKDDGTEITIYDEILTPGEYILKFDDLQSDKEYKGFCIFNNNNGIEDEENSLNYSNYKIVIIGDVSQSSFPSHLIPSKDFNRKTQCADFIFAPNSDSNNLNLFGPIAEKYCYDIMNEGEPIQIRITGSAECTFIQDDDNEEINKDEESEIRRKFTICAKAGPFNRDLKYKKEGEKVLFKENFDKFVDNLSNGQKIEDNLGLSGLIVESTYREKRFSINEEKVEEEKEVEKEDKIEKEVEKVEEDKKEKEAEKVEEDKKEKEVQKEKEEDKVEKEKEKLEEEKDSEDKNELEKEVKEEEDKVEKEEDKREEERDKLQEDEKKENDSKSQEEERKDEEKTEEEKEEDKREEGKEKEEDKKEEEKEEDKKEKEKEERERMKINEEKKVKIIDHMKAAILEMKKKT